MKRRWWLAAMVVQLAACEEQEGATTERFDTVRSSAGGAGDGSTETVTNGAGSAIAIPFPLICDTLRQRITRLRGDPAFHVDLDHRGVVQSCDMTSTADYRDRSDLLAPVFVSALAGWPDGFVASQDELDYIRYNHEDARCVLEDLYPEHDSYERREALVGGDSSVPALEPLKSLSRIRCWAGGADDPEQLLTH